MSPWKGPLEIELKWCLGCHFLGSRKLERVLGSCLRSIYIHSPTHSPTYISEFVPCNINLSDPTLEVVQQKLDWSYFLCRAVQHPANMLDCVNMYPIKKLNFKYTQGKCHKNQQYLRLVSFQHDYLFAICLIVSKLWKRLNPKVHIYFPPNQHQNFF
jgi:hypothetical protein